MVGHDIGLIKENAFWQKLLTKLLYKWLKWADWLVEILV